MSKKVQGILTVVKTDIETGKPLPKDAETSSWTYFLQGEWTREVPRRPGKYPIANVKGAVIGEAYLYRKEVGGPMHIASRKTALHDLSGGWDGWWWSRPMPSIMPHRVPNQLPDGVQYTDLNKPTASPSFLKLVVDNDQAASD